MNHIAYNEYCLVNHAPYPILLQAFKDDGIEVLESFIDPASLTGKIYYQYPDNRGWIILWEVKRIE